jgi:hypothetical protein
VWRRLPLTKAVNDTDRSAYIGFNRSNQHLLCAAVLTYFSTVHFLCKESRLQSSEKCI